MARYNELVGSKEALLRSKDDVPLRSSLEEAYKSSSEDEGFSDYDAHKWNDDSISPNNRTKRFEKEYSGLDTPVYAFEKTAKGQAGSRLRRFATCCRPTKRSLLITFITLGTLILLLTGSGFWVYKHAPEDGVCLS